jgi:uncharacterized membrane protein
MLLVLSHFPVCEMWLSFIVLVVLFYLDYVKTDSDLNSFMTLQLRNFFVLRTVWWISNMVVPLTVTPTVSHLFNYNTTGTFIYVILLVWHFLA